MKTKNVTIEYINVGNKHEFYVTSIKLSNGFFILKTNSETIYINATEVKKLIIGE